MKGRVSFQDCQSNGACVLDLRPGKTWEVVENFGVWLVNRDFARLVPVGHSEIRPCCKSLNLTQVSGDGGDVGFVMASGRGELRCVCVGKPLLWREVT